MHGLLCTRWTPDVLAILDARDDLAAPGTLQGLDAQDGLRGLDALP